MVRPETGYIKITNFVESTTPELDAALEKNPVLEQALAAFPEAEKLQSLRRAVPETRTAEALGKPSQTR